MAAKKASPFQRDVPTRVVNVAKSDSQRVRFTADYDHIWPSLAMTFHPAGYEGRVKAEVAARAIALGRAEAVDGE
jgi:hypothetical protein